MFLYKAEFEDDIFYTSENYNDIIDFIEKSNKKGHWRIYANPIESHFDLIHEINNKEKQKLDLPKSFTKGETIITLEKDTDYPNSIIISISANGEDIVNNTEAYIRASSEEGVFLIMSYKPIEPEFIGFTKYTKIYINDYPDLINYLYKLGKNKELLKNYI